MNHRDEPNPTASRRKFLQQSGAGIGASILSSLTFSKPSIAQDIYDPNGPEAKIKEIQIKGAGGFVEIAPGFYRNEGFLIEYDPSTEEIKSIATAIPGSLDIGWLPKDSYSTTEDGKYLSSADIAYQISIREGKDGSPDMIAIVYSDIDRPDAEKKIAEYTIGTSNRLEDPSKKMFISGDPDFSKYANIVEQLEELGFNQTKDDLYARTVFTGTEKTELLVSVDKKRNGITGLFLKVDLSGVEFNLDNAQIICVEYKPHDAVCIMNGNKAITHGGRIVREENIFTGKSTTGETVIFSAFPEDDSYDTKHRFRMFIDGKPISVSKVTTASRDHYNLVGRLYAVKGNTANGDAVTVNFKTKNGIPEILK